MVWPGSGRDALQPLLYRQYDRIFGCQICLILQSMTKKLLTFQKAIKFLVFNLNPIGLFWALYDGGFWALYDRGRGDSTP